MMGKRQFFLLVLLALIVFPGFFVVNHLLNRSDRLAANARAHEMIAVRDQLLRFEFDHNRLPATLDELVKNGYLRRDEIEKNGTPLYRYDPDTRVFGQVDGAAISGLITYHESPISLTLPPVTAPLATPGGLTPASDADNTPTDLSHTGENTGDRSPSIVIGEMVTPFGSKELPPPPDGSLVFEAEQYSDTNYGWEVHPDPNAGGGAYLHCKEGIANGPGQIRYGVGNFYDIKATKDLTYLRYYFHLPAAGRYYIYGRMWTTGTHCSNHLNVDVDRGGPGFGGMDNRTPFRWIWTKIYGSPQYLSAGDHYLHVFIHEDGIRVDQYILSPKPIYGDQAYAANFSTGTNTAWQAKNGPPVHISFDLKSAVFTPKMPPDVAVVLRRLRPHQGSATLRVTLHRSPPAGVEPITQSTGVNLDELPELLMTPLKFNNLDALPRREYLLTAELVDPGGAVLASARVPLMKPLAWETFGPGKYISNSKRGPLDGDGVPLPGDTRRWVVFKDSAWDHFGVLDFGLQTTNNSLHAKRNVSIYARTRIHVPETKTYLIKIQSDDQLILWIDGKEVCRNNASRPVTRSVKRVKTVLSAGDHRVRIRVNQRGTRWQAYVRFREEDDTVSNITGLDIPSAGSGATLSAESQVDAPGDCVWVVGVKPDKRLLHGAGKKSGVGTDTTVKLESVEK